MIHETRRGILLGAGSSVIALAGCSSEKENQERGEFVAETVEIGAGEHRSWKFVAHSNMFFSYSFTVLDGPAIDVILMREHGYTDYTAGNEFVHYQDGTTMDSKGESVEIGLSEDNIYYLVLDNTAKVAAKPPSAEEDAEATVEIEAEINPV